MFRFVRGLVRFILFVLSVVIHSSNNKSLDLIQCSILRLFVFNQVRSLSNPDQIESKMEILWCPDTKSDDHPSEGIKFNSKPSVNSRFELNSDKLVSVNFVYLDFRKNADVSKGYLEPHLDGPRISIWKFPRQK